MTYQVPIRNPNGSGRGLLGNRDFSNCGKRALLAALLLIWPSILAGCVSKRIVEPAVMPLTPDKTVVFKGASPLQIVNAQNDAAAVVIHPERFGAEYYGDMHDWTRLAISLLQSELSQRDIEVVPHARKKLILRVINARLFFQSGMGNGPVYARLSLELKGSSLPVTMLEGSYSASLLDKAAGGALASAVAALLRNPAVTAFLKE